MTNFMPLIFSHIVYHTSVKFFKLIDKVEVDQDYFFTLKMQSGLAGRKKWEHIF